MNGYRRARAAGRFGHIASIGNNDLQPSDTACGPAAHAQDIDPVHDLPRRPNDHHDSQPDSHRKTSAGRGTRDEECELRVIAGLGMWRNVRRDPQRRRASRAESEPPRRYAQPGRPAGDRPGPATQVERETGPHDVDDEWVRAGVRDRHGRMRRSGERDAGGRGDQGNRRRGRPLEEGGGRATTSVTGRSTCT